MQNRKSFPRIFFLLTLLTSLCVVLVMPRLESARAAPVAAIANHVVISEFRTTGPSGANDEFIELYNPTSTSVNITGWKIKGSNNDGTATSTRLTVGSVIGTVNLQPGQHYLAARSGIGNYTGATTPDETYSLSIANDGGIALYQSDGVTLVDAVGMSSGSAYQEGFVLTPLTNNLSDQSYERKYGGCWDTDDNLSDFILNSTSSNPQNMSSPVTVCSISDLSITTTVNNLAPNVGDYVIFTVTVSNLGPSNATNVQVTDTLQAGRLAHVSDDGGMTYDTISGNWTWLVGSLASGTSKVLTITAQVASASPGTNTASVTNLDQYDPNGASISVTVIPPVQADLSLTQSVDVPAPNVGSNVIFTITISNAGPYDATNVQVKDLLPTGLTWVSDNSGGTYVSSTGIWTVGTVTNGTSNTLNITAKVTTSGTKTNWAEVWKSDQTDPNSTPGNGSTSEDDGASKTVTPQVADLSITKTIDNVNPSMGAYVVFTVTVSNAGPNTATNVEVKDSLPSGLTYVSDDRGGIYDSIAGGWIWTISTLANGASQSWRITATVNTSVAEANWAEVWKSDQYDPDSTPGNGSRTEDDDAGAPSADLSMTQSVNTSAPGLGGNATFTITVSNAGPGGATNVQVKDLLPTGLTYVSDTGSGAYDSSTGIWTVGSLTNGANKTLTITAKATTYGEKINWAEVWKSDQPDPDSTPGNSSTTEDDDASAAVSVPFPSKSVLINEVAWGGTVASSSDEWIELYNPGAAPVNLTGWKLNAVDGSPAINLSGIIPAYGYFLLGSNTTIFSTTDVPPVTVDQTFSGSLSNSGEILHLLDSTDTVVDTANSDGGSWPAGLGSPTYASMERFDPFTDGTFSWGTFAGTIIAHDKYGYAINGTPKHSNWIITVTLTPTAAPRYLR